jgi:hypothetical protein
VPDFSADRHLHASATGWEARLRYVAGQARNDLGRGEFERAARRWFGEPL